MYFNVNIFFPSILVKHILEFFVNYVAVPIRRGRLTAETIPMLEDQHIARHT
jgi:hypothetical protein